MSNARVGAFKACKKDLAAIRDKWGLQDVEYRKKMTRAEVKNLWAYLSDAGFDSMDRILTQKGLRMIERVLCRWPRPSELGVMARDHAKGIDYFMLSIQLSYDSAPEDKDDGRKRFAQFVGTRGNNLNALTERHDLLYAWMHPGGDLSLFATDRDSLVAAAREASAMAQQFGLAVTDEGAIVYKRPLDPKAPEWIPAKKAKADTRWERTSAFKLNPNAPAWPEGWKANAASPHPSAARSSSARRPRPRPSSSAPASSRSANAQGKLEVFKGGAARKPAARRPRLRSVV